MEKWWNMSDGDGHEDDERLMVMTKEWTHQNWTEIMMMLMTTTTTNEVTMIMMIHWMSGDGHNQK